MLQQGMQGERPSHERCEPMFPFGSDCWDWHIDTWDLAFRFLRLRSRCRNPPSQRLGHLSDMALAYLGRLAHLLHQRSARLVISRSEIHETGERGDRVQEA